MKYTFSTIIAIFFLGMTSHAQNYYISSSAATNGNGTLLSPWNSFASLNTLLATSLPIDTIFLKRGDVFREQITIQAADNFVITAYGTGNNPVISGADLVLSWTQVANTSYWQANFSPSVINFFVNDKEQILARYPDDGAAYLTVDGGSTNTTLNDAALSSISSSILNQSQVCVHTAQWCWEKSPIASSTNTSITYQNPTLRTPTANYGYFLYDHLSYLTTGKEWKYDATDQKIYYQPAAGNPNNLVCEASVRSYGILFNGGVAGVEIRNITFEKQTEAGIAILNPTNQDILIDGCNFARQYKYGIDLQGEYVEVANSYFREIDGLAVYLNGDCFKSEIHHNIFRNNGGFLNSGVGEEINLSSIKGAFVDSCHIHHNDIDSAGYCGISMDGRWNIIERNIVKNAMLLNNDGAALKSFGVGSQYNIFRNNFVSKSDGNTAGTPSGSFITPAIYFDFSTNNCTIKDNTIYDRNNKGIFLNSGTNNNTVTGNVVYGGNYLMDFNGSPIIPTPMTGMTVTQNVLFAKDPAAYILRMVDNTNGYHHGVIDSNYYFQPYNSNNYVLIPPSTSNSFSTWVASTGYDTNSKISFVNWTLPTSDDTLFMNQTDNLLAIDLGNTKYLNLDMDTVCGTITLQPYTSKILIRTTNICTTSLEEEKKANPTLQVYPNPFSTYTVIETDKILTNATLTVLNALGQPVKQMCCISESSILLHKGDLPSGIYFIRLEQDNRILGTNKLVITD
jgi:parallel beta-helix repeat protein